MSIARMLQPCDLKSGYPLQWQLKLEIIRLVMGRSSGPVRASPGRAENRDGPGQIFRKRDGPGRVGS